MMNVKEKELLPANDSVVNIEQKEHFHGSDLEKIEKIYHIKKEDITSFSANVNPLGLSQKLKKSLSDHLDVLTTYPDREYTALRKTIGNYCHINADSILVGNGSTELISLFIQFLKPHRAAVLAPTYSEYEREIAIEGGEVFYIPLKEEENFICHTDFLISHLDASVDLFILCNPNNPTSSVVFKDDLRKILQHCKENHTFVMIDETYIEFVKDYESVTSIPFTEEFDNLIVLRGVSKFFASPGLRLGYAVTGNCSLLQEINEKKNPWTINSLAEAAGQLMFTDTDYIKQTKELIASERDRICTALSKIPSLKYYKPYANFILVKICRDDITAAQLFDQAIKQGMMIRDCSSFHFLDSHFFRFCIMMPEDNDRLLSCIRATFASFNCQIG